MSNHNCDRMVLRDLQSMLRKRFNSELDVVKFATEAFLSPGEHYGSTIFKVDAVVKKSRDDPEERLHLVAKMLPSSDFQRAIFDSPFSFKKEVFFYTDLMPFYRRLELELCPIPEDPLFDLVPEYYGSRLSMDPKVEEVDDDAVLLMENLRVRGFYMADRRLGLDLSHSKKVIRSISRFHALGMAVKYKKPHYFEILKIRSRCMDFDAEKYNDLRDSLRSTMCEDPELREYSPGIKSAMSHVCKEVWNAIPTEPWSTIIHRDCWTNNIMFRRNPEGELDDDVKFVDFQNYLFLSPLQEVVFFLVTSLGKDVATEHFDALLDLYYGELIANLRKMQCDVGRFTRTSFEARLKIDAVLEFSHCPFIIKMASDVAKCGDDSADVENDMMDTLVNPLLLERLRIFVKTYVRKGWLEI